MYGKNVSCAVDTTTFIVNPMSSSRVMHVGGQCIYFCCQACQVSFWRDPGKYIVNAGADASSTIRPKSSEGGYPDLSATVVGFGSTFVVLSMVIVVELLVRARTYVKREPWPIGWLAIDNIRIGAVFSVVFEAFKLGS